MTDIPPAAPRVPVERGLPVALLSCPDYAAPRLRQAVFQVLESAGPRVGAGLRVLVKPNLLTARSLACAAPEVTAAACAWLLERGARVEVADSPGFGRAEDVARKIGLEAALRPLKLQVRALDRPVPVRLPLPEAPGRRGARFMVARRALECDLILSVPRVKAHSQMLLTLAVKNCFGCVSGLRKAFVHAREGRDPGCFADCLAALWAALPPVAALADGVRAALDMPQPGAAFRPGAHRREPVRRGPGRSPLRRAGPGARPDASGRGSGAAYGRGLRHSRLARGIPVAAAL